MHPDNPRYFTDTAGKAIYLTGLHTWVNLQDAGPAFPPPKFNYDQYLDLLEKHNHNFTRLWTVGKCGLEDAWFVRELDRPAAVSTNRAR